MPTLAAIRASNAAWQPSYTPVGIFVGGTSGIGEGIVDAFARHTNGNAHIVLVGRNRAAATSILARLPKPTAPGLECTRELLPCDLSLIANAKRAATALAARFPRGVNFVFLSAGAISLNGLDVTEEGVDRQMAALYYSKWALIDGLLPALRAARAAGEDARVAAIHTAGRGGPIDLTDLGLAKARGAGGLAGVRGVFRDVFPQLASYQDLMAEGFAAHSPTLTFTHAFPGTAVNTPLLRASPSPLLRTLHYLLFPMLLWRAMGIDECGERQLYALLQVRLILVPFLSFHSIPFHSIPSLSLFFFLPFLQTPH
ncbi:NAD(P)-binding protein [Mycena vulgaris]|nr:NAD(P)-binding protein [Mycena vulgaris]